jgi:hypothetical protein
MKTFWIPFVITGSVPIEADNVEKAIEDFEDFINFQSYYRGNDFSQFLNTLEIEKEYIVEDEE